jgi:hypothetical protein
MDTRKAVAGMQLPPITTGFAAHIFKAVLPLQNVLNFF